jgi:hypothetical protein
VGTWVEVALEVANDGLARFRLERAQGTVHRDMIFNVVP